jgi:hypothetical protein
MHPTRDTTAFINLKLVGGGSWQALYVFADNI